MPRTPPGPRRHRARRPGAAEGGSWERDPRLQAAPLLRDFPARPGVRPRPRMLSRITRPPKLGYARSWVTWKGFPGGRARVDDEGGIARPGFSCRRAWPTPGVSPARDPEAETPRTTGRALPREAVYDCRKRTAGSAWLRCPICSTLWPEVVSIAPLTVFFGWAHLTPFDTRNAEAQECLPATLSAREVPKKVFLRHHGLRGFPRRGGLDPPCARGTGRLAP